MSASIQAQLEQNDVPEFANEPGPGHYFGPESVGFSSLGPQRFAKNASAPEISMPRTGWNEWEKVRISKTHARAYVGRDSPGAAYDVGGKLNDKTTRFGTGKRPPLSQADPHGSPGPVYDVRTDVPVNIGFGFGEAKRFGKDRAGSIGPGQYPRKDTALQTDNGRSIGAGRQAWEKVITIGWESEGRCRASPGPGAPLWRNIKQEGSHACPFGKAERFPSAKSQKDPGPGQYRRTERDVSNTKQHLSDTRNPQQIVFGKKPTKPRFRVLLAQRTAANSGWGYF